MDQKIVTNLWFDTEAGPRETGMVMTVDFELNGQLFTAINGGPDFQFDEAVSLLINCSDQDEVDYFWGKLTEGGGEEGVCGWVKDRYGFSWQVVPEGMDDLFADDDPERANRAMAAMLKMRKLDVEALRKAAEGE